jgi:hypothetical protein
MLSVLVARWRVGCHPSGRRGAAVLPWVASPGRAEDKTDDSVWAVTCFVTHTGLRRRGASRALTRVAVDFVGGA